MSSGWSRSTNTAGRTRDSFSDAVPYVSDGRLHAFLASLLLPLCISILTAQSFTPRYGHRRQHKKSRTSRISILSCSGFCSVFTLGSLSLGRDRAWPDDQAHGIHNSDDFPFLFPDFPPFCCHSWRVLYSDCFLTRDDFLIHKMAGRRIMGGQEERRGDTLRLRHSW